MSSLPNSAAFTFGSASSGYSFHDAIQSYRRSQYLGVSANVASSLTDSDFEEPLEDDEDLEAGPAIIVEEEEDLFEAESDRAHTPSAAHGDVGEVDWDDIEPTSAPPQLHPGPGELFPTAQNTVSPPPPILVPAATEGTPLLRKSVSFTADQRPHHDRHTPAMGQGRRPSMASQKSVKYHYMGKSTFGQTLFNSIAILLGIGMLSEPLAFAYAGWIGGTFLIISYGWVTCYTAKILGHIILADPSVRSYADIGRKAFGPRSIPFISTMFCLELFAVSVALVTLFADSLHTIMPEHSANTYKVWGLIVLIPTVFMPLSLLSYTSILGITSTLFIIFVIFWDGLAKRTAPGSLWEPAPTSWLPGQAGELGISFGLFMAGFSGHAVIPSLAKDMVDPTQFDKMIDWAFMVATAIYALIGCAGYMMFGHSVHDEISVDLLNTPGYPALLNKLALWTFVISPLSKFALATRPVNITLEIMLGLEPRAPPTAPDDHTAKPRTLTLHGHPPGETHLGYRRFGIVIERVAFAVLSVAVSIGVPDFSSMMAFIGSFSAFFLCVIGPIAAKVAIERRCGALDALLFAVGLAMAVWGTGAAFWAAGAPGPI